MFSAKLRLHIYLLILSLSAVLALLNSACLWGVVRDAETGEPIVGAEVKYTDVGGDTGTATTDANGLYAFDQAIGPYPASGPVSFQLTAVGYQAQPAARLVQYNDNPNASFADLSSFWEVQNFGLTSAGIKITNIELLTVDVSKATLPPVAGTTRYFVTLRAYGTLDPLNPSCEQSSGWVNIVSTDPAPLDPANLNCMAPGKDFLVSVTVLVERQWTDPAAHLETDVSTATWGWETSTNSWQGAILDSTDTSGPDDPEDDLWFDASIRYRTGTIIPLWCEE